MVHNKQKKNQGCKGNRLLISVSVLGSSGPIRFVVNEGELVGAVIDIALKSYACEGRYLFLDRILMSLFFIPQCWIRCIESMGDNWTNRDKVFHAMQEAKH
ncbi:hypothetical protein J1N35_042419 [Gossypium stocksii]|uniref:DUF7054 domain-containing protein n=1 Tax=Gossypium stocksii TaxID=47602 RepID=A0A9D3ZKE5_9ROSI|nr:hypothetical protein J1N35_042419 [Gossypium stocksii]